MRENFVIRRRHLPHWDVPGATYFVTTCLAESIPARGQLELAARARELQAREKPPNLTESEHEYHLWKLHFARVDDWLDQRPAVRHLEQPALAQIVVSSLLYFANTRYDLLAFCVMPSHYHWVFQPRPDWIASLAPGQTYRGPRERIQHSINLWTSRKCNKSLRATDAFWQRESYDHCVRDLDELMRIIEYVELNPVKAGLAPVPEAWPYSSAYFRAKYQLRAGTPLIVPRL